MKSILFASIICIVFLLSCSKNSTTTSAGPTEICIPNVTLNVTKTTETTTASTTILRDSLICGTGKIYIPKYFTPNGNGVNDIWFIGIQTADSIKTSALIITDNCSNKIFTSDTLTVGWDGSHLGNITAGIYNYNLSVTEHNGQNVSKSGTVQLILD